MSHAAPPADLADLRVLLTHDWLVTWGGAERCLEEMLGMFPQADICVGLMDPAMRPLNAVTKRARETWLGRLPGAHKHHRWFVALEGAAFASVDTSRYDLVLSSSHAFAKMVRRPVRGLHLSYCYSPPRYLYDLGTMYRRDARGAQRLAFAVGTGALRRLDLRSARGVDRFVAISGFIRDRIRRAYGRDADVVYPPVSAKAPDAHRHPRGDFLLHLGRLVPYKRVDLAVQAAERVGMRLVVAGDGPELDRLRTLAGPRTEFLGAVSEAEAARLLSTCAAFVFSAEEDFGIAPVEANAHGAPVVGYGKGGLTETMVEGETAEFFSEQTVEALSEAIVRARSRQWDVERLRENAERFAPERFRESLGLAIERALGVAA